MQRSNATPNTNERYREYDPFRFTELPAAWFLLSITVFTILWKSVGLAWLPFGLDERFMEVFTKGYYPRDMEVRENEYNLFFLLLYGCLGTAAQYASIKIAGMRALRTHRIGFQRHVFATFHLLIAVYHVLFVFRIVHGKMILDDILPAQMVLTRVFYLLELTMAVELFTANAKTFYRRKVCLDLVSGCNLIPLLIFWGFAVSGYQNPLATQLIGGAFFAVVPFSLMLTEWITWWCTTRDRRAPHASQSRIARSDG